MFAIFSELLAFIFYFYGSCVSSVFWCVYCVYGPSAWNKTDVCVCMLLFLLMRNHQRYVEKWNNNFWGFIIIIIGCLLNLFTFLQGPSLTFSVTRNVVESELIGKENYWAKYCTEESQTDNNDAIVTTSFAGLVSCFWIWIVSRQGPRTGASHRRGARLWCSVTGHLASRLLNSAKEPAECWHDGLRQSIPVFHCSDAVRLSINLSMTSHSNQFLLICIDTARRSRR